MYGDPYLQTFTNVTS